jgi:hypothetical protein
MANVKISQLPVATTPLTGAELIPVVQNGITRQTTITYVRAAKADVYTATAGQTLFNLSGTYVPGSDVLQVFVNGLLLIKTQDYTETSSSSVTFTSGLLSGDQVVFRY